MNSTDKLPAIGLNMPVTTDVEQLLLRYGVSPYQHAGLVKGIVSYVYDQMAIAVNEEVTATAAEKGEAA